MAQAVYSVNVVGYVNKTINPGLSLVANQLNASPNNSVQALFGTPVGPLSVNKFNAAAGNYDQAAFDPDGGWSDPTSMVLNPGQGAFLDNAGAAFTITFVGEVQLTSTVNIHTGLDIYSSVIPQSAPITSMGFPIPTAAVTVFRFNGSSYDSFAFDPDAAEWSPSVPVPNISEAFFIDNTGGNLPWSRTFVIQ
jgi:hypothetical protein